MGEKVVVKNRRARILLQTLFALALASILFACSKHSEYEASHETHIDPFEATAGTDGFVIEDIRKYHQGRDYETYRASGAGDVNGDGLDDLIVGLSVPIAMYNWPEGTSCVIFGKADGTDVEYSDIAAGVGGFVITGLDIGQNLGIIVTGVGDVNGDGLDDVIIWLAAAVPDRGECYVIFGKTNGTAVELSDIAMDDNAEGFRVSWKSESDLSDWSVSGAGDVNGDGLDDLIVGAPGAGDSYVVFGKDDGETVYLSRFDWKKSRDGITQPRDPPGTSIVWTPVPPGKSITDGYGGFVIKGIVIDGIGQLDAWHASVSGAGDVNGDGLDDLIVSRRWYTNAEGGKSTALGFVRFNDSIPPTISERNERSQKIERKNRTYVIFGKANDEPVALSDIATDENVGGFIINETVASGGQTVLKVRGAGDVNGDGFDDLIVGVPFPYDGQKGEAYVVFGKTSGSAVNLSNIATGGFKIVGSNDSFHTGFVVSAAGDMNGDGLDDVIVGLPRVPETPNRKQTGGSYVVFGKASNTVVELSDIEAGTGGFMLSNGGKKSDVWEIRTSGAGDVNGDGFDDLIVSDIAGRSYVIFGPMAAPKPLGGGK